MKLESNLEYIESPQDLTPPLKRDEGENISHQREIDLTRKIAEGKKAKQIIEEKNGELSLEESEKLRIIIEEAEGARDMMIYVNTRFVEFFAKKNAAREDWDDAIQEGMLGLMRAIEDFDPDKGLRFRTYARWWIESNIKAYLKSKSRVIKMSNSTATFIQQQKAAVNKLKEIIKAEPTVEEIALHTGCSLKRMASIKEAMRSGRVLSISEPLPNIGGGDLTIESSLRDTSTPSSEELVDEKMLIELVREKISELNDRERTMIEMRYGLKDKIEREYVEIGEAFGITGRAVTFSIEKILEKLKKRTNAKSVIR
jgi:RNA polymerase sigma factor (sigma-70 family)